MLFFRSFVRSEAEQDVKGPVVIVFQSNKAGGLEKKYNDWLQRDQVSVLGVPNVSAAQVSQVGPQVIAYLEKNAESLRILPNKIILLAVGDNASDVITWGDSQPDHIAGIVLELSSNALTAKPPTQVPFVSSHAFLSPSAAHIRQFNQTIKPGSGTAWVLDPHTRDIEITARRNGLTWLWFAQVHSDLDFTPEDQQRYAKRFLEYYQAKAPDVGLRQLQWVKYYQGIEKTPLGQKIPTIERALHRKALVSGGRPLPMYVSAEMLLMDRKLKKEDPELYDLAKATSKSASKQIREDSRKNKDLKRMFASVKPYLSAYKAELGMKGSLKKADRVIATYEKVAQQFPDTIGGNRAQSDYDRLLLLKNQVTGKPLAIIADKKK